MSATGEGIELRGLCWDHPRCTAPMAAAATEWARQRPGVVIRWDARPLAAFNDQPIAAAVAGYDLVFVDHPMMGETAPTGCLAPLDDLIAPSTLAALAADSIAGSHDTYGYAGHQWALAIDAACQVAVASEPGLARLGAAVPRTWTEVLDLARRHPAAVAIPLYPSDAFCALLSMSAGGLSATDRAPRRPFTEAAVESLIELAAVADPSSFDLNPPVLLDLMSGRADPADAPAYAPLIFGYSRYQRPGAPGRRLRFHDVPASGTGPGGGVLGGAGLAVTAAGRWPGEAAAFAAWIAGATAQRDIVCAHQGQPASTTVWADPSADRLVGGFFSGTRATIERAHVRPREPWWPRFQKEAGARLARLLRERAPARKAHAELAALLDRHRTEEGAR
jgi:multiple sugar transport system substrate-binding protein